MPNKKPTFKEIKDFMRSDKKIIASAQTELAGLVNMRILIDKGIITEEEWQNEFDILFETYVDVYAQKAFDAMSKENATEMEQ